MPRLSADHIGTARIRTSLPALCSLIHRSVSKGAVARSQNTEGVGRGSRRQPDALPARAAVGPAFLQSSRGPIRRTCSFDEAARGVGFCLSGPDHAAGDGLGTSAPFSSRQAAHALAGLARFSRSGRSALHALTGLRPTNRRNTQHLRGGQAQGPIGSSDQEGRSLWMPKPKKSLFSAMVWLRLL